MKSVHGNLLNFNFITAIPILSKLGSGTNGVSVGISGCLVHQLFECLLAY
jgi:hypothetical protein